MGAREQVARRDPAVRAGSLALAGSLLLAACGGAGGGGDQEKVALPAPTPSWTFSPAPGASDVAPDTAVTVTASDGKVTNVVLHDSAGERVDGEYDPDAGTWTAGHRLRVSEHYTVTASALDSKGAVVEHDSDFSTLEVPEADRLYAKTVAPHDGDVVGVAQPLVVGFNHPVRDKQAVQDALHVETEVPGGGGEIEGAWYWVDDEFVDYRPKEFWPAGTKVTLHVDIGGLKAGPDRWGGGDRDLSFTIGRKQVIKVDVRTRVLKVVNGKGKVLRSFPVSTGRPGWETRNGTKVLMEKVLDKKWTNEAIDAPEFYRLKSSYAMRMTNSGEFIHDAPWATGTIGSANTSHGCVGLRVPDMKWVYNHSIVGDPVIVTHSKKPYTNLINRYADWNIDWDTWSAGNADKEFL